VASALAAGVPVLGVRHLVELAPAPGLMILQTLDGVDLRVLGRLLGALTAA
jgi:hypothetical protein